MEFNDMKKIWDSTGQAYMYAIDEQQLAETIRKKKRSTGKFVSRMEWFLISVNFATGLFLLIASLVGNGHNWYIYLFSFMLLIMGGYIYYRHRLRIRQEGQFDRSMLGELKHAISNATYQARLAYFMLLFSIPAGILLWLSAWSDEQPFWFLVAVGVGSVLVFLAARWEYRSLHIARKRKLEMMLNMLTQTDPKGKD